MTARTGEQHGLGDDGARSLTSEAVARLVNGTLRGDADVIIRRVAPLGRAGPEELSVLAGSKHLEAFATSRAGAVLVMPELAATAAGPSCRILVEKPMEAMLAVLPVLYPSASAPTGIHSTATIGRGVRLGRDVAMGAYAVIEERAVLGDRVVVGPHCHVGTGVTIGDDSHLVSSVTLYPGAVIGRRVRLHAGVRVGGDGFGYVFADGAHRKIPHVGRCVIEDDVEVGANTTIDRGSIDDTVIGAGTKIDNLVMIAHNVHVGRLCVIAAQVGIAGSTHVGDGCVLAGQVGVAGHLTLGDRVTLGGQSGVMHDIPDGETWSGCPAHPHRDWLRASAAFYKLGSMMTRIERLLAERDA